MNSKLLLCLTICLASLPAVASAAGFIPLVGIPGVDANAPGLGTYINAIYRLSISIAALLAVIKIVAAGAKYMLSDIVTSKEEAKKDIQGALIGLLIVLAAVVILTTVNSDLTKTDLLVDAVEVDDTQPAPGETLTEYLCAQDDGCTRLACSGIATWGTGIPGVKQGFSFSACNSRCSYLEGDVQPGSDFEDPVCTVSNDTLAEKVAEEERILWARIADECEPGHDCTQSYYCNASEIGVIAFWFLEDACASQCSGGIGDITNYQSDIAACIVNIESESAGLTFNRSSVVTGTTYMSSEVTPPVEVTISTDDSERDGFVIVEYSDPFEIRYVECSEITPSVCR